MARNGADSGAAGGHGDTSGRFGPVNDAVACTATVSHAMIFDKQRLWVR